MTAVAIEIRKGERFYGRQRAFAIDHLQIFEQECVGVKGRNGSGKSTLLRILAGITQLSRGSIESSSKWQAAPIAYCPQSGGAYGDLSLGENLTIVRRRFGRQIKTALFEELWEEAGLAKIAQVRVQLLSGGFQKLAALACALASPADVLVLDEPTADLHPSAQAVVVKIISKASSQYYATVFAEHSETVLASAHRTIEIG